MTHRNHHEREFEAFLAGEESELARLYRRLPQSEPDAKLDSAVLAMARAAVEPQRVNALRHAKMRPRRPWWLVGLSSAAGVVLAAGIAWQMRNGFSDTAPTLSQHSRTAAAERDVIPIEVVPEMPAAPAPPAMAPPVMAESASTPPAAATEQPADASSPPPAMRSKTAPLRREVELAAAGSAEMKKDQPRASDSQPPPAPPAPAAAIQSAAAQATSAPPAQDRLADTESADGDDKNGLPAAGMRAQPFPGHAAPDHNSVERKAAIASGSRRDDYGLSADAAAEGRLARQDVRARIGQEPSATAAPAAAAPKLAKPAKEEAVAASPAGGFGVSGTQPAAPASAAAGSAAKAEPERAATEQALKRNEQLPPEEWVKVIRQLLRDDRRAEALDNLQRLRERHPRYAIPADLRALR